MCLLATYIVEFQNVKFICDSEELFIRINCFSFFNATPDGLFSCTFFMGGGSE